jgi:RNA polymerase sigma-70 factor (ECF subfamily)
MTTDAFLDPADDEFKPEADLESAPVLKCPYCETESDRPFLPLSLDLCCFRRCGDPQALNRFWNQFEPQLDRYLRARFFDNQSAMCGINDFKIETMIRFAEKISTYKCTFDARPWLFRVAHNIAVDMLRTASRRPRFQPIDRHDDGPNPDQEPQAPACDQPLDNALRNDELAFVKRLLDSLPFRDRSIFQMRALHDHSFAEIAQTFEIATSTACKIYAKIRDRLREECQPP